MRRGRENDRDKKGKARSHWNVEEINFPVEIFQNAIFALFDGSFVERLFVNKDVSHTVEVAETGREMSRDANFLITKLLPEVGRMGNVLFAPESQILQTAERVLTVMS